MLAIYLAGVAVRHHLGSCVDIRNTSGETIRQVSIRVEGGGKNYDLPDLAPGDHRRVYVQPEEKSGVTLTITDGRGRSRDINVYEAAVPGECAVANVEIQVGHRTETIEDHKAGCWSGWLSLM